MRFLLAVLLCFAIVGVAAAVDSRTAQVPPDKYTYVGDGAMDGREGGETFATAFPIPSLPFNDTGATCDNTNDIIGSCHSDQAPDVVYSYTPAADVIVNVSLCGSGYDTALTIWDSNLNELYCNDDFCGLQSEIDNVPLTAGQTYYFVVDGFSTACGSYTIAVFSPGTGLECPAGALAEGEPDCYDGYYDTYDGGCNSTGWLDMCPQEANHAVMCGAGGTYLYGGSSYRDTDWIRVYGANMTMTATCTASFPLQFIFIYNADCNNLQYQIGTAGAYVPLTLSQYVNQDMEQWMWVGASVFSGVPCGSLWVLEMDGISCGTPPPPVPTENHSWGSIKNIYK